MIVIFTNHAIEALEKRNIQKAFIERSVNSPDFETQAENDCSIILKKFGNKFLKIILVKKSTQAIIITAYWFSTKRAERLKSEN